MYMCIVAVIIMVARPVHKQANHLTNLLEWTWTIHCIKVNTNCHGITISQSARFTKYLCLTVFHSVLFPVSSLDFGRAARSRDWISAANFNGDSLLFYDLNHMTWKGQDWLLW